MSVRPVRPSIRPSVHPSVRPSVCLSVYPSGRPAWGEAGQGWHSLAGPEVHPGRAEKGWGGCRQVEAAPCSPGWGACVGLELGLELWLGLGWAEGRAIHCARPSCGRAR